MQTDLILGLPNGSLQQPTFDLLHKLGMAVNLRGRSSEATDPTAHDQSTRQSSRPDVGREQAGLRAARRVREATSARIRDRIPRWI